MCVAAFLSQQIHRSVTAEILLPDMFLRCDTVTPAIADRSEGFPSSFSVFSIFSMFRFFNIFDHSQINFFILYDVKMTVRTVLLSQDKMKTQGLFDPCACTSQDEYCTTELCLSVDKLKKKKTNNKEDNRREETVLV